MDEIEKREAKIMSYIKKNPLLIAILSFAFIINFYYFLMTKNQPLWWDEAVYMINASHLLTGFPSSLYGSAGRSILEVFMWSFFFKLGLGYEVFFRFLHVMFMTASVFMIYWLGKEFFDEFIGLFSAFVASIFWVYIFTTTRFMPDNFGLFVFLLAMVFFYKGYLSKEPRPKYLWVSGALWILSVYAREITALFGPVLVAFILIKEKTNIFKNKKIWGFFIAGLLAISPFLLFYQIKFGDPIVFYTSRISGGRPTLEEAQSEGVGGVSYGASTWIKSITFDALRPGLVILFLIGLTYFGKLLLGFDYLFKKTDDLDKKRDLYNRLFLFFWIFLPFFFFIFWYGLYDERYISTSYPAIFFIAGFGLKKIYEKVKKNSKPIGIALVIFFLLFISIAPINSSTGKIGHFYRADSLIKNRIDSQAQVRDAGAWIKQNSNLGDLIISQSEPQMMHYSQREVISISKTGGENKEEFIKFVYEKKPKYLVLSVFEPHPNWAYGYPQENPNFVIPVQAYVTSEQQPLLIIYEFNYTSIT